jgi:hypothetical protein
LWQGTISTLRDHLPAILKTSSHPLSRSKAEELIDRARVAISQAVWEQHMQYLSRHADIAYRLGQMNARFHAAGDEAEIYDVMAEDLSGVGNAVLPGVSPPARSLRQGCIHQMSP